MNKTIFLFVTIFTILTFGITGCSGTAGQTAQETTASDTGNSKDDTALSQVNMLLVGTLKLEDTDKAVTAAEATALLPLWQAYRSLGNSQTSAEAEVDALLNQIESTMTTDQIQAIITMELTGSDMMTLMQSMGGGIRGQGTPDPQSTPEFDFPTGGFEGGSPPSGDIQMGDGGSPSFSTGGRTGIQPPGGGVVIVGGGPGGDAGSDAGIGMGRGQGLQGTPDPSMQATAQARFTTQATQVNTLLLNMLISKLEAITSKQ